MEWSGVEWSGVEWSGVEWSGVEWSGVERIRKVQDATKAGRHTPAAVGVTEDRHQRAQSVVTLVKA